jgi:hypothetical protein
MYCQRHSSREADFQCTECERLLCEECVDRRSLGDKTLALCPLCETRARPTADLDGPPAAATASTASTGTDDERSFWVEAPLAFGVPFSRGDWLSLLVGGIFALMVGATMLMPLIGIPVSLMFGGYLTKYFMDIVNAAANGEDELPRWPVWTDIWNSCIVPLFQISMLGLLAYAPAAGVAAATGPETLPTLAASAAGSLYLPMGYLGLSLDNSITGLNPFRAAVAMFRVPFQYLYALLGIAAAGLLGQLLSAAGVASAGVWGLAAATFTYLYVTMVESWILGRLYYTNRTRLSWYGEA